MATGYNVPAKLSLIGNISENWKRFRQSFEVYVTASGLDSASEPRKVAILLNVIGEEGLDLYNTFPKKEDNKLKDVLEAFETHCNPKSNVLHSRYIFYKREQKEGETVDCFLTDTKLLAKNCKFCDVCKNSMIRDKLVLGTSDTDCQKKLIKNGDPSLEETIEALRISALTSDHVRDIQKREINSISKPNNINKTCYNCGYNHQYGKCPAFNKTCAKCEKKNHFAKMCRSVKKTVHDVNEQSEQEEENYFCGTVTSSLLVDSLAWYQLVLIEGVEKIKFKLDPGADVNILPTLLFHRINNSSSKPLPLKKTSAILESWNGFKTPVEGTVLLNIEVNGVKCQEVFCVAGNNLSVPILSRDTCVKLNLVKRVESVTSEESKDSIIKKNVDLFSGIGKIDKPYEIKLKKDAIPSSKPPYRVPLKLRTKLQEELDKLTEQGIISKVDEPSEWVNRLVLVEKPDGSIRLCLDPKDLNDSIVRDYCSIPTLEDLSTKIQGAKYFTVLDLKDSFWHILLTDNSSKLCTFATIFGTYRFNRLPFGIAIASEVFQKTLSEIFADIPGVVNYIDDILLFSKSVEEMNEILRLVFKKAREFNIKFNRNKFQYMLTEVSYLGHTFKDGTISPDPDSIEAVLNYDQPKNKHDVQRLLGLVNYLRPFIPNLAETTAPLRDLLKKDTIFDWQKIHTEAFENIKFTITKKPVLHTFDPDQNVTIQTDASKTGIGCVLMQNNRPVCFASKALTQTEINYGQIEKEYLAVLFACKKFHNYIYGRKVTIQTDHLPLISIMKKDICNIPSTRLQRIRLKLSIYNIDMVHVPGSKMHIADALSRACSQASKDCDPDLKDVVHSINVSDDLLEQIKCELARDPVAIKLQYFFKNGWPNSITKVPEIIKHYYSFKNVISFESNLIFIDKKLYIPDSLKSLILQKLHDNGHFGMTKTKGRAKALFYWKNMYTDIEKYISACKVCKKFSNNNIKEPMLIKEQPDLPFQHVSTDILHFGNDDYLVLVDNYSKWIELHKLPNKSAEATINILKLIFSVHGIPEKIYSDNVPFNSAKFIQFSNDWKFKCIFSSPHYHQSNGAAEKAVGICKAMLRKCNETRSEINDYLLEYRNTPVCGTPYSPSQLLFSRLCRTKLPAHVEVLRPAIVQDFKQTLIKNAETHKKFYDVGSVPRNQFIEGQHIFFKQDEHSRSWQPGTVKEVKDNRSISITDDNGVSKTRNTWFVKNSGITEPILKPNVQPDPQPIVRKSNRDTKLPSYLKDYVT